MTDQARACRGNDPTCPCQDGDVCHYEDDAATGTKAMTDQAQEREDVIREVLENYDSFELLREIEPYQWRRLVDDLESAIARWESHIPRERAGEDAEGLIADAYQLIDWWLDNPDHVSENREPMAHNWIERAARWAAGDEPCLCGALRSEHHASSLVSSGCVVSPQVGHHCPCVKFSPIASPREPSAPSDEEVEALAAWFWEHEWQPFPPCKWEDEQHDAIRERFIGLARAALQAAYQVRT